MQLAVETRVGVFNRGVVWSLWFRFGAGAMFCVSGVGYPLPKRGFAMATKTCRAAKLYQRPLNSMRSLSVLK